MSDTEAERQHDDSWREGRVMSKGGNKTQTQKLWHGQKKFVPSSWKFGRETQNQVKLVVLKW